jgi:hypothetical protein
VWAGQERQNGRGMGRRVWEKKKKKRTEQFCTAPTRKKERGKRVSSQSSDPIQTSGVHYCQRSCEKKKKTVEPFRKAKKGVHRQLKEWMVFCSTVSRCQHCSGSANGSRWHSKESELFLTIFPHCFIWFPFVRLELQCWPAFKKACLPLRDHLSVI